MTSDYWTDFNGFVHKPTGRFSCEPEEAMNELNLIGRLLSRAEFEDKDGCSNISALLREAVNEIAALRSRVEIRANAPVRTP